MQPAHSRPCGCWPTPTSEAQFATFSKPSYSSTGAWPSGLGSQPTGRDCPRSAPRRIRHLQLAGPTLQHCTVHTGYRDCLPTHPFIHPFPHCLPLATYQPILSHLSCAPNPIPKHPLPRYSRVPFFDPTLPNLRTTPERSFPTRPSTAAAPNSYIYLGTPQFARVRLLPGRASSQLPRSPPRLGLTRLDCTHTHTQHQRPPTLSSPLRSFPKLCTLSHLGTVRINQTGKRQPTRHTGQADEYRRQRGPAWRALRRDRAWPATATQWPQSRQQKLATARLVVEATVPTRGK